MQTVERSGKIRIDFHPIAPKGPFAVEKQDGERKRRYLEGVTSGLDLDGHGERMTEKCIESFKRQATSGDILLYAGKHDINYIEDLGRLASFSIDTSGEWQTSYRLYDSADGEAVGPVKLEAVNTVWAQANGLPPYTVARGFGFSIEGDIPEGGILYMDEMGRRVIDDVKLAGVVLVRNPAYRTSVAHAVMKALGLPTSQEIRKALSGNLAEALDKKEQERDFYDSKYQLSDALEEMLESIMKSPEPDKQDRLRDVFGQYGDLMIDLILAHPEVYQDEESGEVPADGGPSQVYEAETTGPRQALHALIVEGQEQLRQIAVRLSGEGAADDRSRDQGQRDRAGSARTGADKEVSDGPHGDPQ